MKSVVLAIGVAVAGCIGSYGQDAQESRKITDRDIVRALDGNVSAQKDTLSSTQLWENAFILLGASAEWIEKIKSEAINFDPASLENKAKEATMTLGREDFETLPDSVKLNAFHNILSASLAYERDSVKYRNLRDVVGVIRQGNAEREDAGVITPLKEEKEDSTMTTTLKELVVESDNVRILPEGVAFIPTKKVKNAASNGYRLLMMMDIPFINIDPQTAAITSSIGKEVNVFIDYQPASVQDMASMMTSDVLRVEYFDYSTDPRFQNKRNILNFVMARYEYGGYTKFNVAANGLSNVDGSLYGKSRFSYKKMTYDLFASVDKFHNRHGGMNMYETFDLPSTGINTAAREQNHYRSKGEKTALTFKAVYLNTKFMYSNILGFNYNHTPETVSSFLMKRMPSNVNEVDRTELYDRNYTIAYNGSGWTDLGKGFTFHFQPSFSYGRVNSNDGYFINDKPLYVRNAIENSYSAGIRAGSIYRFKPLQTVSLSASYDYTKSNVIYGGSYDTRENLSNQTICVETSYSFQSRNFFIVPGVNYIVFKEQVGNLSQTTFYPSVTLSSQYSPVQKHLLMMEFNFNSLTNGINEKSDILFRNSENIWYKGNPHLKMFRNINGGVNYMFIPSQQLYLSASLGANSWIKRSVASYSQFPEMNGILRTFINSGNKADFWAALTFRGSFFNNALTVRLTPIFTHELSTGIYSMHLNRFAWKFNVSYFLKDFYFTGYYFSNDKTLSPFGGEIIHKKDTYGITAGYGNSNWNVELSALNFLRYKRAGDVYDFTSDCYSFKGVDLSGSNRFRLMLSIDYKFGYGKKVSQRDEAERVKDSQSAISRY